MFSTDRKIIFLGPAWPYRGGIATIIETLARVFASGRMGADGKTRQGTKVDIYTFSVQYPAWLFPGRSQFRDGKPPEDLHIVRCINTINPFNWFSVGRRIRREAPDFVVLKYWTPFMAPCFGTIARVAKRRPKRRDNPDRQVGCAGDRGGTGPKFLVQLDNVIPHEHSQLDTILTKYFVRSMDGFIYMSEQVGRELAGVDNKKPRLYSPHPMFDHFGEKLSKDLACNKLKLDPNFEYVMFFGLVRAYKGLDMLIDAWSLGQNRARNATGDENETGSRRKLLIVGEFYDNPEKYRTQISELGLEGEVILADRFVPDDEVGLWFSAADLLVLPYRTATQSGVTQIAYRFDVPMVVTNVGGLPEIVPDGVTGYVCEPEPNSIAAAIEKFFEPDNAKQLRAGFAEEKKRFSWAAAADKIEELYLMTQEK